MNLKMKLDASWEPSMQIGSAGNLKSLAHPKLLKTDGSDFRGDADQTLQLMVLMTFSSAAAIRCGSFKGQHRLVGRIEQCMCEHFECKDSST
jgi:hypothetical protein